MELVDKVTGKRYSIGSLWDENIRLLAENAHLNRTIAKLSSKLYELEEENERLRTPRSEPMDLKELRSQIKQSMDRDKVKAILEYLGYEVYRNYTFKLREERTPSASIRRDGYIKDFGSGWGGDIVALLHEYHATPLPEATKWVAQCLGIYEGGER